MTSANARRTAAAQRRRRELLEELCWRPRACEVRWDADCEGLAVDSHEPLLRSRGGAIDDRTNIVLGCRHCHDQVHRFPEEATRRGFLIPSWAGPLPQISGNAANLRLADCGPDPF